VLLFVKNSRSFRGVCCADFSFLGAGTGIYVPRTEEDHSSRKEKPRVGGSRSGAKGNNALWVRIL
jgi:hypothetical protein